MDFLKEMFDIEPEKEKEPEYNKLPAESRVRAFNADESKVNVFFKNFIQIVLAIAILSGLGYWIFSTVTAPVPEKKPVKRAPQVVIVQVPENQEPVQIPKQEPATSTAPKPATPVTPSTQPYNSYNSSSRNNSNSSSGGIFDMLGFLIDPIMDLVGKIDINAGKADLDALINVLKDPTSENAQKTIDYYVERILNTIDESIILPTEIKNMIKDFISSTFKTVDNEFSKTAIKNLILNGPEKMKEMLKIVSESVKNGRDVDFNLLKDIFESVFNS